MARPPRRPAQGSPGAHSDFRCGGAASPFSSSSSSSSSGSRPSKPLVPDPRRRGLRISASALEVPLLPTTPSRPWRGAVVIIRHMETMARPVMTRQPRAPGCARPARPGPPHGPHVSKQGLQLAFRCSISSFMLPCCTPRRSRPHGRHGGHLERPYIAAVLGHDSSRPSIEWRSGRRLGVRSSPASGWGRYGEGERCPEGVGGAEEEEVPDKGGGESPGGGAGRIWRGRRDGGTSDRPQSQSRRLSWLGPRAKAPCPASTS